MLLRANARSRHLFLALTISLGLCVWYIVQAPVEALFSANGGTSREPSLRRLPSFSSRHSAPTGPPEPLLLPSDFDRDEQEELCHRMYGPGYFDHIETHCHRYCEPASSVSAMTCLFAPRLPHPWLSEYSAETGDPICIVRGVAFDPSRERHFRAQCDARDFAAELRARAAFDRVDHTTGKKSAAELEDIANVPNLDDIAVYWGNSGVGGTFRDRWDFSPAAATRGCSARRNNGRWLMVLRREDNINVWHALMTLWQAMMTVDAMRVARDPATGEARLSARDLEDMQIVWDDDIPPGFPMDDWWSIINGKAPVRPADLDPGECWGSVLVPLAGSSSPFWAALLENVYHQPCRDGFFIDVLRRRVFHHLGIEPRDVVRAGYPEEPSITLVNRTRTRKFWGVDRVADRIRSRYPNSRLRVVDLAEMTMREQVELAAETDVFVAHHGAGMMHLLWLPADAAVVEISTAREHQFRSISRLRGLSHFEAVALEKEEFDHAMGGPPPPEGWRPGLREAEWQSREYSYLLEDDFLGWVDAAVRNQRNRRYQ